MSSERLVATSGGGPLEGLRVLELASEHAAFAGKLLGDLGAEVLLVEPPGGHPTRHYAPFVDDVDDGSGERSLWFWHYNTSKYGVVLDRSENAVRVLTHRARRSLKAFLCRNCSIYNTAAPCRCENLVGFSLAQGWIGPGDRQVARPQAAAVAGRVAAAISDVAGLYETAPMGGPEQGPYLNSVAVLETDLAPAPLLDALQSIETSRGRERVVRWGPRSLDLDIVAMAPGSVDSEHLVIPHPRAVDRRFVVEPLCEVWPEALVTDGVTASEALSRLGGQDVDLLDERWVEERPRPDKWWVTAQFALFALIGIAVAGFGTVPTAAWTWWRAARSSALEWRAMRRCSARSWRMRGSICWTASTRSCP